VSGATGAAGGNAAAGRKGPGPSAPQGGTGGSGQGAGLDQATTSLRPNTGGGTAAARRRQGGPQGQQAQQAQAPTQPRSPVMTGGSAAPAAPAAPAAAPSTNGSGYSSPTTYQKGQPTPAGGTRVPGAARPPADVSSRPGPGPAAPPSGRTRRARLRVSRTDPWSVMKISFLLSIALGVVTVVGVSLLWMVLDTAGVFSSVGGTLKQATGTDTTGGFDLQSYLSFGNVLMTTALIAVIDVVLLTALATLGSFIYNMAAGITGGVELTLSEEE
jgi:hypothetical protein